MKTCTKCGKLKSLDAFNSAGSRTHPYRKRGDCKACTRISARPYQYKYYLRNRDKRLTQMNANSKAHPWRSRATTAKANCISDGTVTAETIKNLMESQHWRCAVSGEDLRMEPWAIDHIWPKSAGGLNTITNIQIVTRKVNGRKHKNIPWDYWHNFPGVQS